MTAVQYFGLQASVLGSAMALAPLLQVRRILARRHAGDISQVFIWVIIVGVASYAADGIVTANWYIAAPNLVGIFTNLGTVLLARHYVHKVAAEAKPTEARL